MIRELIYQHFENDRLKKESYEMKKDVNFSPSTLTNCKRRIFYKKTKTPASNPIDTHSYIKFSMGDAVHEKIQDILKDIGIFINGEEWKETEWQGLKWIYRYDGKIFNQKEFIIEIKSKYAQGIDNIEKFGADIDNELQLFLYMIFENIKDGILFFIGRDNGHMVEFNYSYDKLNEKYSDLLKIKIEELKKLKIQIENNELPDRDFQICIKNTNRNLTFDFQKDNIKYKSDWHCNYCSYKDLCWQDILSEIKNNSFYIDGGFIK